MEDIFGDIGPAAENQVTGFQFTVDHLSAVLGSLNILQDLAAPPAISDDMTIYTGIDSVNSFADLVKISGLWKRGFSLVFYFIHHARARNISLDEEEEVTRLFNSLFPTQTVEIPDDEKLGSLDNTILLINYFNGDVVSGAQYQSGFMKASGMTDTTPMQFANDRSVAPGAAQWMHGVLSREMFSRVEFVQNMWDICGPLIPAWVISHSAAGSAAFNRLLAMCDIFGIRPGGPLRIYLVFQRYGMMPAMGVAYFSNSFGGKELEGRLATAILMKVAACNVGLRGDVKVHANAVLSYFRRALGGITEGPARTAPGSLIKTMISNAARVSFNTKLEVAAQRLSTQEGWSGTLEDVRALNNEVLYYQDKPDVATCRIVARELGVTIELDDHAGENERHQYLRDIIRTSLADEREGKLMLKSVLKAERQTVIARTPFLAVGKYETEAVAKLTDFIMSQSGNLIDIPEGLDIERGTAVEMAREVTGL